MSNVLELKLDEPRAVHRPGAEVTGVAAWTLDEPPKLLELRVVWVAESRGGEDVGVVETLGFPVPGAADRRAFRVRLPEGPPSFRGQLMRLSWTLELVAEPSGESRRIDLHLSPTGSEIVLPAVPEDKPRQPTARG